MAKAQQKDPSPAKDIFLATLGFYGKVYEESSSRLKEMNEKREERVQKLVKRGAELEAQAKEKFEDFKSENVQLDERLDSLRASYDKLTAALNPTDTPRKEKVVKGKVVATKAKRQSSRATKKSKAA